MADDKRAFNDIVDQTKKQRRLVMTLVRWNPSLPAWPSDMLGVQREINRLFDGLFRSNVADEDTALGPWAPAVDITESDNEFVVKVEVPGVSKDDVKITVQDNVLTIRGEKKQEKESKGANYHRVERSFGAFQRSFSLPATVQATKVDAKYNNGILSITLPKAEEAKPKEIEIHVN
jgi:HSP20 family protein